MPILSFELFRLKILSETVFFTAHIQSISKFYQFDLNFPRQNSMATNLIQTTIISHLDFSKSPINVLPASIFIY